MMKNVILFAAILFAVCTTTQNVLAQSQISKFKISFKVPKETQVHKVKDAQVVINHEEQYNHFDDFTETVKRNRVLHFDGKSVGNTFQFKNLEEGQKLNDFKIKSPTSNKSITLRGVTIKSIKKRGQGFLTECEYLSAY